MNRRARVLLWRKKSTPSGFEVYTFFVTFTDKVLAIGLVCILRHIEKAHKTLKNSERLKKSSKRNKMKRKTQTDMS